MNYKTKLFFLIIISGACIMVFLSATSNEKIEKNKETTVLPFYQEATFTPNWLTPDSETLNDFHKIPSFNLTNQDNEIITEKTFENKVYITDFFFTICPGICPKMTANMSVLQEAFLENKNVLLLSHSVMPDHDSPEILKKYAEEQGVISGKWHLVTGKRSEIYSLGRDAYFVEEDLGLEREKEDFLHTENFVLIDKNGHIRGIYNGLNKAAIQQLITDVETLQKEE